MIEADLARHYNGFDLCDLWRGKVSLRKVRVLIDGLPADSNTVRALAGSDETWSLTEQLLGRAIDELAALRWDYGFVHQDPKKKYPPFPDSVRGKPEKAETVVVSPHSMALHQFVNSEDFKGVPQ